jgi:nucleoside 2-deoxyribosyltransferase
VEDGASTAGSFQITQDLSVELSQSNAPEVNQLRPFLSAYSRQHAESGQTVTLDNGNWRRAAEAHRTIPVPEKVWKLLRLIGSRTTVAGSGIQLNPERDCPLIDAATPYEFGYLYNYLLEHAYIHGQVNSATVLIKGWEKLQPVGSGAGIPGRCFVAMSFDPALDNLYLEGIEPAIRDCGFTPVRVDREHYNEDINDRILAEIRLAQFIVADFTQQKHGVYFEAGFAMGLGRPVIWLCSEDDFKNRHFDTDHYNHIKWHAPADLRQKLADRIRATIGDRNPAPIL